MTFRLIFISVITSLILAVSPAFAQTETVIGQLSNSAEQSFAGGISGNGRFVVFESRGNLATENPRNADNNVEIFLFDYAQRRIFQITDTKSVLYDTSKPATFDNVRVEIVNTRPVISNDGKWIAFSSNATTARPTTPLDTTNPGLFNGNDFTSPTPTPTPTPSPTPTPTASPTPSPTPGANPLTSDGNLEMWIYEIPSYAAIGDLAAGDEVALTWLGPFRADGTSTGGRFIRVTNTDPSQLPRPGSPTSGAFVADDNHDASITDDGNVIAFGSTRDLIPGGNSFPLNEDNDEIFTFVRSSSTLSQVTKTPRGLISNPIYNKNPTISGNGQRVVFASTGDNPVVGMTGGNNPLASRNEEIFYTDLGSTGAPTGTAKQVTVTTPTNPGDPVNILDLGRRMSRDGRYIAFDSYADLAAENNGTNHTSFALYLYETTTSTFRRILARSNADSGALGGDIARYPGFTDYTGLTPSTLVLETRMNIKPDGTIPTTAADGLNPNEVRPAQIYSYPLNLPATTATFTRLGKFPVPSTFLSSTQLIPSDSLKRMTFNLSLTEFGTGNLDQQTEVYYLLHPVVTRQSPISISLATGASLMPVSLTALPTPTPTPTPSPTPTPTPTPTPSPSPSPSPTVTPSPSPTPGITPPAVHGIAPGMLAVLEFQAGFDVSIVARSAKGSLTRSFTLPIELSGLTMTINGAACGLRAVSQRRIEFVVPPIIDSAATGTTYPLVINNNGTQMKTNVTIVPARPDIFNTALAQGPGGRAKLFNVTNTVHTTEPFVVRTILRRGNRLVPSVLRLYLTGFSDRGPIQIKIRGQNMTPIGTAVLVEPGVHTLDFALPPELQGAGDQPVIVTITIGGVTFSSRLDDTAARVFIL